jgi:chemotaxis methyl-accepting protein methylase
MQIALADPLAQIARLVEARHGVDFRRYKPRCLMRRLHVRMRAVGAPDLESYARLLAGDAAEVERLFEALSINFSFFWRDGGLFRILSERLLPELARAFPSGPLRLWSAGCAAGEELYSLGILASEVLPPPELERVALLGTDLDEKALDEARQAAYPPSRLSFLDKSLTGKYFHPGAGGDLLRVSEGLRRRAEFRKADLLGPAPYRKVALICCRNVMIYLQPSHQEQVLERLAEALAPGGILALGRVERLLGASRSRFETVDAAERIYRRIGGGEEG